MSYFKNKNIWFWGFIILLIINISVIGSMAYVMYNIHNKDNYTAFHHKMMKKGRRAYHGKNTRSLIKNLKLTKEQQKELSTIRQAHFKRMKSLKKELFITQHQLFEEVGSSEIDSTKIRAYRSKMMDLQGKITDESIQFLGEMKKHLNAEQQEIMKQHFREKYQKGINPQNINQ